MSRRALVPGGSASEEPCPSQGGAAGPQRRLQEQGPLFLGRMDFGIGLNHNIGEYNAEIELVARCSCAYPTKSAVHLHPAS